jgi:hypothetical protein
MNGILRLTVVVAPCLLNIAPSLGKTSKDLYQDGVGLCSAVFVSVERARQEALVLPRLEYLLVIETLGRQVNGHRVRCI